MERTSSLDLFRGSEVFSDLDFLDGQEIIFEPSAGQAPTADRQNSQPVTASLPISSTHLTSGQRPSSKLFHSSRVATAPAFSSWPQAASNAFTPSSQPAILRHDFLSFDNSISSRPASAAESQTDSFAALLADDTALGFADDCFRRESELFFSQERAVRVDAPVPGQLPSIPGDNAVPEEPAASIPQQSAATTSIAPAPPAAATIAPAKASAQSSDAAALTASAPAEGPALVGTSDAIPTQAINFFSSQAMPAPATHQARSPAFQAHLPVSNAPPPITIPLSAQKQPEAHDTFATDAHPGASTPARAEESLETQEHTVEASEDKSVAKLASAAPHGSDMVETSPACSPKSIQSPPSPQDQHAAPAQLVTSTPSPHSMHQTLAASSGLPPQGSDPPLSISMPDPSASQAFLTAGTPVLAGVQQATTPVDTSRQPVNDQAAAARPQLSVQEYSLPEARNAEFLQEAEAQAEPADLASVPKASSEHRQNHSSQVEDTAAVDALLTEAPLNGTTAGPAGRATSRRWGHQLTQVFRAAAAGFPGRTGLVPNPDTKLTASAPQRLPPVVTIMDVVPQAASGVHEQPTVSDQLQKSHSQPPAHPHLPASHLHQSPVCASARLEQPLGQSLYQPQTHGHSSSLHLPPSTSAPDQVSQPVYTSKTANGLVPATQLHGSLAAAPLVSVSRQDQDLADTEQQPEGRQSASAAPEGKAHRQALTLLLKAEPQLHKVEVTVQAQTDQHVTRQAHPATMHLHQQEQVVHSPQKPNMLPLQPQPTSVSSAQAPISSPAEGAPQAVAQASQSIAVPASGNQDLDVPHCEVPHAQLLVPPDQEMLEASVKQTGLALASHTEAATSAVPTVLAECLASNRIKRVPGGDPLEAAPFRRFVEMVRSNSHDFEAQGRVLRLKQYISADVRPAAINAILEALAVNTLVEVLYIQNFEQGMFDEQLLRLTEVLKKGRIWALNAGENFEVSMQAWEKFTKELQHTAVAYMYVSEHHLVRTDLKKRMQDAIRDNRRQAPRRDAEVIKCVGNMWWNPKLPLDMRSAASRPTGGESALASLARDMVASQAGSRHSGSDSQSRKRKDQPHDTAVSSQGGLHAASSAKSAQKAAKRQRQAATAAMDSPQATGSAAESQPELTLAERREMRIKRREQRQVPESGPVAAQTRPNQDACRGAASSPAASHSRTPASALPARRAPGPRSRLAEQSGPSVIASADSDSAEDAAAMAAAEKTDPEAQDSLSGGAAEEVRNVPTGRKRKLSQLQPKQPAVAVARSVRLANSIAAGQQPEPDAMTEQSRSSEAAMPVGPRRRRGHARNQSLPVAQQVQEEQEEQEAECEQHQPVRRTGRQRKLTAAAVAAVEDFPSLYKQPAQLPASVSKVKVAREASASDTSHEDWPEEAAVSGGRATQRSLSKQAKAQSSSSNGVNQVQMSQLVRYGVLPAGQHEFLFKNSRTCEVEVFPDGDILYQGELYDSLAKLGKAFLEESSTGRQSCNCWRDITWQGDKMETLRQAAHNKFLQLKRFPKK